VAKADTGALRVETHSIDRIPDEERHGSPRGLFAVWFGANLQLTTVVTGALAPSLGLSVPWALLAIMLGNLFGAVFMALHSAQGPRLGIPQMIQSRAQFGFYGAILPLLLVILMYVGFFASSGILAGEALAEPSSLSPDLSIAIVAVVCVVITIFGYRVIHLLERTSSALSAIAFCFLTVLILSSGGLGAVWHVGPFHGGKFLLMVAIAATWQISYAPYVADYSRYLPTRTSIASCFWWTYAGSVVASVWMMAFGALAVAIAPKALDQGLTAHLVGLAPSAVRWPLALAFVLGVIAVNVLNLYGAFMSFTTTATAIKPFAVGRGTRIITVLVVGVVGTGLAIAGRLSFVTSYTDFILFLTYFLIPWTSINLVDFYFIRRERYDISAIFRPDGRYGAIAWRAIVPYLLGVAIEVPFTSTSFYTGPMVSHLGGADISWILGLIVSAGAYYLMMKPSLATESITMAGGSVLEDDSGRLR
jgi:NCS1 family nucleobase:cation symporter-1